MTARSALGLRAGLAGFGLLLGLVGVVVAWWVADPPRSTTAVVFGVVTGVAAVNLVVVLARMRRGQPPSPVPRPSRHDR